MQIALNIKGQRNVSFNIHYAVLFLPLMNFMEGGDATNKTPEMCNA